MSSYERLIMNVELKDFVASSSGLIEVLSGSLPGGTENNESLSEDKQCLDRNSNRSTPAYTSRTEVVHVLY
jgi:hypothetical protein